MTRRFSGVLPLLLALVLAVGGVAVQRARAVPASPLPAAADTGPVDRPADRPVDRRGEQPNMVFILMDDFSLELLATMPNAQRMASEGATYESSFVVDSLCCPSRAALLTGQMPHQTGVLTNTPNDPDHPIGGYAAFVAEGNEEKQFTVALQDAGYRTGFVGKFLNGYEARAVDGVTQPPPAVPGWSDFQAILGGGYNGWGFKSVFLDDDGAVQLENHPKPDRSEPVDVLDHSYAQSVTARKALRFLGRAEAGDDPYFLEIATYGPHGQLGRAYPDNPTFPSAFADRAPAGDPTGGNCGTSPCGDLGLDDLVGYGDPRDDNAPTYLLPDGSTAPAPAWRTNPVSLTDTAALTNYRDRARMVQSIDRMVGEVRAAVGPDTYVFLTADNGFHLGQHQLNGGKGTPYDSDTRVPLVVAGPGVVPGTRSQFVNNIDLAPTFEDLAGLRSPDYRSGRSFADSLSRPRAPGGDYAFFEHTYSRTQPGEVDTDEGSGGTIDVIPSYVAIRGERGLLVRVDLDDSWTGTDHAWELYDYAAGFEDRNVFAEQHDASWARDLMRRLEGLDGCKPRECRRLTR